MWPGRGSIAGSPSRVPLRRCARRRRRADGGDLVRADESVGRPGPRSRRSPARRPGTSVVSVARPGRRARRRAQRPARRGRAASTRAGTRSTRRRRRRRPPASPRLMPTRPERRGEALRRRQRVAAGRGRGRVGQVGVDVEPHRAGQVPALVRRAPGPRPSRYQRTSTTRTSPRCAASHSPLTSGPIICRSGAAGCRSRATRAGSRSCGSPATARRRSRTPSAPTARAGSRTAAARRTCG